MHLRAIEAAVRSRVTGRGKLWSRLVEPREGANSRFQSRLAAKAADASSRVTRLSAHIVDFVRIPRFHRPPGNRILTNSATTRPTCLVALILDAHNPLPCHSLAGNRPGHR